MGNRLSCSCAPLLRKGYSKEDAPWQGVRRRDGHLLRLWAEVFHVTTGGGTVRWQQVSEDLVPVNVTCVQDHPDCIFHVTAYNSHVDKILDVRISQPGTRIGQASECFIYWKDPVTGDTWGLNFTSPVDAKQFRECCSLASKFSRKASSSYSLRLDTNNRTCAREQPAPAARHNGSLKRRTISTPSSPSHTREPQCTCMTAEQYARLRAQDPRYRGLVTLPRNQCRPHEGEHRPESCQPAQNAPSLNNATESNGSSTEKRNNEAANQTETQPAQDAQRQQPPTTQSTPLNNQITATQPVCSTVGVQATEQTVTMTSAQSVPQLYVPSIQANGYPYPSYTLVAAPGYMQQFQKPVQQYMVRAEKPRRELLSSKSVDHGYAKEPAPGGYVSGAESEYELNNKSGRRNRSKSSENVAEPVDRNDYNFDSGVLKRMIQPVMSQTLDRPVKYQDSFGHDGFMSEPETSSRNRIPRSNSEAARRNFERSLYLDFQRANGSVLDFQRANGSVLDFQRANGSVPDFHKGNNPDFRRGNVSEDYQRGNESASPASDQALFEHGYYATTPSSSPANSDTECGKATPTTRLLLEYEQHLRNTLAKGLDAESCSLHTFEAMLSQSMENLGISSNTLPLPPKEPAKMRAKSADRGRMYGVDRDRGYLSDFSSRANSLCDRQDSVRSGYLSDRESIKAGVVQQGSVESADSRLCYLTSSEVSDDDRMSLTTAVSDEEEGGSADGQSIVSPHKSKKVAAAAFNCTGAVRKAGFLSVKKWLIRKRHQVELAHKRGWRGYWVCLKGTTLLFYPCDARDGRGVEAAPRHLIIVDGAILQPIPEHPKRDFVFCLSTAFGDAYLFQAPCQAELENWVNSIHSACAASFARHRGKTGTLHLLQEEIYRIERSIESDSKLRHMAELQLSVVSDADSRRQITAQIAGWDDTLERLHCEQFRLRCYMASLQRGELPNPKGLLTHVSRSTKRYLNQLGVFTVSSLHAYICARSPSLLNNLLAGRGATRRRSVAPSLSRSNSLGSRRSQSQSQESKASERVFSVNLPDGQSVSVAMRDGMTVEEFLSAACSRRGVNPAEHFVRVKKRQHMDASNHFVPHRGDPIDSYVPSHEVVEICAKTLYQVELTRTSLDHRWGFSVEAELVENADRQDELGCIVSRVEETGLASDTGLQKGDEIMVLNGALVADLDMMYIESVLQEELSLCLMLRSCRADPPAPAINLSLDLNLIDSLVCPPPPSDALISDDMISGLIVPAPSSLTSIHDIYGESSNRERGEGGNERERSNQRQQEALEKNNIVKANQRMSPTGCATPTHSRPVTPGRSMSEADRLRKVLKELVGTERTYVQHLNCLLENYLEPLQKQTILSTAEINALFGNIREIVAFQRLFLAGLESAMDADSDIESFERAEQFQDVLCGIAGTFLRYVYHFRLYSSFCASHSKAQKILHPVEGSPALQSFLTARNPGHQHSSTLESHLIRPIQRVLHYPLLLTQLKTIIASGTEEFKKIDEALRGMERVAEHINEMQRIHEEYGAIFEHLARQHQRTTKQTVDLSPGALLHYGGVEWLNLTEFLGKVKRGLELHAMTFVFSSAVVFLCKERLRQKRKIMSVSPRPNGEVEVIRYQVLIPVSEVQVRSSATKSPENNYRWELVHLRNQFQKRAEKVYSLSNSTAEFRNAFLKTIRQIIRESVRNMSIPSTKLSSSRGQDYDNLYPKEGRLRSQILTEPREEIVHRSDGTEPDTEDETKSSTSTSATQRRRSLLGRTPNHLSLSTTSTISTGSCGSQSAARLVHASNTPAQFKPQHPKPLGSPVWKTREEANSFCTLPRASSSGIAARQSSVQAETRRVPYATLGRAATSQSVRHLDC